MLAQNRLPDLLSDFELFLLSKNCYSGPLCFLNSVVEPKFFVNFDVSRRLNLYEKSFYTQPSSRLPKLLLGALFGELG
jgi:hypothetical protein